jgi:hypothetical protein
MNSGAAASRQPPDHGVGVTLTLIGWLVSLVSVSVSAPSLTWYGVDISEVCCACARTPALSSDCAEGVMTRGGLEALEELLPPHAVRAVALTNAVAPTKTFLNFMLIASVVCAGG